jgi:hypothetical protein
LPWECFTRESLTRFMERAGKRGARRRPAVERPSHSLGRIFVLGERLENEITNAFLRVLVGDGAEEREAPALAVDRVLAGREGYVSARGAAAFPDRKSDQLEALSTPSWKCSSASASLPGGLPLSLGVNFTVRSFVVATFCLLAAYRGSFAT